MMPKINYCGRKLLLTFYCRIMVQAKVEPATRIACRLMLKPAEGAERG